MVIEPLSALRLEKVAELETICFSSPWSPAALGEELSNEQAHFLTAACDGEVVGYIGVQEICGEGYITNVAVFPAYRRQGIAEKLIHSAIDGAKKRNCSFLSLEVRKSNAAAISLYNKCGFQTVGERKNFYADPTEDAAIMTINF